MHEVLVKRLGGLSLHRTSVVRLTETDQPDVITAVFYGRKTTTTQQQPTYQPKKFRTTVSLRSFKDAYLLYIFLLFTHIHVQ